MHPRSPLKLLMAGRQSAMATQTEVCLCVMVVSEVVLREYREVKGRIS